MTEVALYPWLLGVWCGLAVVTWVALERVTAPYGRHARSGWGPTVDARVGWIVMELPAVLTMPILWWMGSNRSGTSLAILAIWEIHYLHRTLVYPFRLPANARRTPWAVVGLGVVFNVANGYLNGRWLFELGPNRGLDWLTGAPFVVGTAVFAAGMLLNLDSDRRLLRLRAEGPGYRVPVGGAFRLVSCPNYLGELMEWLGWAILTWSPGGAAFAFWTAANLVPRARAHHRWYRERFPTYPAERRAMIPWLV